MQECKIQIEVPICSELKLGIGQDFEHEGKEQQISKTGKSDLRQSVISFSAQKAGIITTHFEGANSLPLSC